MGEGMEGAKRGVRRGRDGRGNSGSLEDLTTNTTALEVSSDLPQDGDSPESPGPTQAGQGGYKPDDFSDSSECGGGAASEAQTCLTGTGQFLGVVIRNPKLFCKFCRCKASDKSPLADATTYDRFGGYRGWLSYNKVKDAENKVVARTPIGKTCIICMNVFMDLGFFFV